MHNDDDELSDAELITRYRAGDDTAASVLFTRHHGAATRFASGLAGRSSADDLAAEAFSRVLGTLRKGHGPDVAFRAYLLTTTRNIYINASKRDGKLTWVDDYESIGTLAAAADESGLRSESALLAQAFATLPERWQTVLWHTSVEDDSAAEVGLLLGISPSAVGALAYRAREGLRQAYLAAHIAATDERSCQEVREKLPAHSRGQLGERASRTIDEHLDTCPHCALVLADLRSITSDLSALLIPALLGSAGAAAIQGRRPRKTRQHEPKTTGSGAGRGSIARSARIARNALSGTRGVVGAVTAVAASCALIVVVTKGGSAPAADESPVAGLGSGEQLALVEQPAPTAKPTPTPTPSPTPSEQTQPVPVRPPAQPPAKARRPKPHPKPPPATEPPPDGTTYDLVLGLANVSDLGDDMSFDLDVSSPDAASTLVVDITSAGSWNFSPDPPAGADCAAPSGTTPVQITCTFAEPFVGTLSFLLFDTGGTKAFTASLSAADNTDPTPGDAAVSFSSP